jgi:hypothetical protein
MGFIIVFNLNGIILDLPNINYFLEWMLLGLCSSLIDDLSFTVFNQISTAHEYLIINRLQVLLRSSHSFDKSVVPLLIKPQLLLDFIVLKSQPMHFFLSLSFTILGLLSFLLVMLDALL